MSVLAGVDQCDRVICYLFILQHVHWELLDDLIQDFNCTAEEMVWDACHIFLESGEFFLTHTVDAIGQRKHAFLKK